MTFYHWMQLLLFIALIVGLTPLLGQYMAVIFQGNKSFMHPILGWLEKLCYQVGGVDPTTEMSWKSYTKNLLLFNFLGCLFLFFLQLFQGMLPFNPQQFPSIPWPLALNTAISFVTNTNWQAYAGETTLSYATQTLGLSVQNFLSAATGLTVLLALIRGISRKTAKTLGNFWADLVRSLVYLFLPLSLILAVILAGEGVIQSYSPYVEATTMEGSKQVIPLGPAASQVAIKQLGTNGGGFFNANSAHPFENPTGLSNLLELVAIAVIPAALTYMYGIFIQSKKHGWLLFLVMSFFWVGGLVASFYSQKAFNPVLGVHSSPEGLESRFGTMQSILWSTATTDTANGSVNAALSSLSPLSGGISLSNILLGELVFGGVGVGLCSMLMFALLTVFLAGLMVGRTPEYRGKKIEMREIKWVMLAILTPGALTLIGAGFSCVLPEALSSLSNLGPHGLTEMLYAFASCAGNNGSAFAGLNTNTLYYNLSLSAVMLLSRLAIVVPSLAVAGLLVEKNMTPSSSGTFSTNSALFAILLIGIIFTVGALTFLPALSLGPIVEHLLMLEGKSF